MVRASWYEEEPRPFRSGVDFQRWVSVVTVLIAINVASFLVEHILAQTAVGPYYRAFLGLNFNLIYTPYFLLIAVQLVTYQFLHHDLMHILINMLMLWFFGRELQNLLGPRRFLFLYLMSGVVGGLVQIAVGLFRGPIVVVGASGAVYGILVYYALMWPNRTVNMFLFPIMVPMKVKVLAMILVGISLIYGLLPGEGDAVAHMCHLGGAVFGFLYFRKGLKGQTFFDGLKARQEKKRRDKAETDELEIDRLLDKIHTEGIKALTDRERKFLNEASRRFRNQR